MKAKRNILGMLILGVIGIVTIGARSFVMRASLIPGMSAILQNSGQTESVDLSQPLPTIAESALVPLALDPAGKYFGTAIAQMVDGTPQRLSSGETPNHLVIDLQTRKATQCVHELCETIDVHLDAANADARHMTVVANDAAVPFLVRVYSDGHYEDKNGETSFYYGHCSAMPRY